MGRDSRRGGTRLFGIAAALGTLVAVVAVLVAGSRATPTPAAVALEPRTTGYVAMGDSYTAGPGIPVQVPEPPGCERSNRNYPHRVAPVLGEPLRDVSCSGAGTAHLSAPQPVIGGSNAPQLEALALDTAVVTLGIGGNDIGFGEIVQSCVVLLPFGSPCRDRYVGVGGDEISRRIAATGPRIVAALAEIHRRAPRARVYVVGYPAILPDRGFGCWPLLPFAFGDVPWLRDKEKELNAMLASTATAGGAVYVDTYGPSVGHSACALPGDRWVEPVVPMSPAAPVHPNARGMEGMAQVVLGVVRPAAEAPIGERVRRPSA
jgi:lysophospholipase L1-like esterase